MALRTSGSSSTVSITGLGMLFQDTPVPYFHSLGKSRSATTHAHLAEFVLAIGSFLRGHT